MSFVLCFAFTPTVAAAVDEDNGPVGTPQVTQVFTAGNEPQFVDDGHRLSVNYYMYGGEQQSYDLDTNIYCMIEEGKLFSVYCINFDKVWSDGAGHPEVIDINQKYYPDGLIHLTDEMKDRIYRVLYAGYPCNGAGFVRQQ